MAFRGEETCRDVYAELCGDFEPYTPSCQGRPEGRGYLPDDAVDRRKDGPEIESLARQVGKRESRWTESIAVGSKAFVEKTKAELGIKAIGREVMGTDEIYELRERDVSYNATFAGENSFLRPENAYFRNVSVYISKTLLGPTPKATNFTRGADFSR
jgi:hypothetical protein